VRHKGKTLIYVDVYALVLRVRVRTRTLYAKQRPITPFKTSGVGYSRVMYVTRHVPNTLMSRYFCIRVMACGHLFVSCDFIVTFFSQQGFVVLYCYVLHSEDPFNLKTVYRLKSSPQHSFDDNQSDSDGSPLNCKNIHINRDNN